MKALKHVAGLMIGLVALFVACGKPATGVPESQVALRLEMRRLWDEHITWTRMYIVSAVEGLPDTNAAAGRLLRNGNDIGNSIKIYYGEAAGNELAALLRGRIANAGAVVAAARFDDHARLDATQAAWMANADSIAAFFARINPNWPEQDFRNMLHEHLRLTTGEAVARLRKQHDADIAAFDEVRRQTMEMADALSAGIIKQFPGKFH